MTYPIYSPTDWVDDETLVDEARMDKIEQGILANSQSLQDVDQRLAAAGGTSTGEWTFSDLTAEPVGGGQVRLNNADQTAATKVWVSDTTAPGVNARNTLLQVKPPNQVYIQDKDDATRWRSYDVVEDAIGKTGYVEFPVAYAQGGDDIPAQRALVSIIRTGAGGATGAGIEYENVWSAAVPYVAGDVVRYGATDYLAVNPSTGSTPPALTAPSPVPVGIGTSLPASPYDGQEFVLVDSLTAPTYQWRFRYVASITDAKKWVFIGGPPANAFLGLAETTTVVGSWVNVQTVGPVLTLPRQGDYFVEGGALLYKSVADLITGVGVGFGDFTAPPLALHPSHYTANAYATVYGSIRLLDIPAGTVLRMKYYQQAAGTLNVNQRQLRASPVRVA